MPNEHNLIPQAHVLTVDEASKGGKASGQARRERKTMREALMLLLSEPLKGKDGQATDKTTQDAIIAGLVKRAIAGDTRAFGMIRDTIGEKPAEVVNINAPDPSIMAEITRRMADDAE